MSFQPRIRHRVAAILFIVALIIPNYATAVQIDAEQLPPARVVKETRADLTQRGCLEQTITQNTSTLNVPPGKPYRVAARDRLPNTLHFCSIESAASLTVVAGETAGAISNAVYEGLLWNTGTIGQTLSWGDYLTGGYFKNAVIGTKNSAVWDATTGVVSSGTTAIVNIVTEVGSWVFDMALQLVIFALTPSTFITNPMVAKGWPLIQGVANIGFFIALLFIAFSTTLNLEIGGGVKKLLPRLFIAALLINFSLVFAGVILDITKVLMALMINLVAGTNVEGLEALIYKNSALFETMANIKAISIPSTNDLVVALVKLIITWSLALSMLALGIGLLIRYIMLILLLIVSPLAYLAFAFPAADSLGKRWWSEFFKYAFYGPIALFFLALATSVADLGFKVVSSQDGVAQALNAAVMSAILIAAAVYAKRAGGTFSVATINFLQGQAKRRSLGAAKATGRLAEWSTRGVRKDTGDYLNKRIRGALPKVIRPVEREKDGSRKKGQSPSLITRGLERFGGKPLTREQAGEARLAQAAIPNITGAGNNPALWNQAARENVINPVALRREHVTDAVGTDVIVNNIVPATNSQNINALVSNKGFLRGLSRPQQTNLINNIDNSTDPVLQADPTLRAKLIANVIKGISQANE